MKTIGMAMLVAGILFVPQLLNAQAVTGVPDSIVQITADAQGLQLVPLDQVPALGGTFWLMSPGSSVAVPLPCAPVDPWPIYALTPDGDQFLVDGTAGQMLSNVTSAKASSILEAQAEAVVNLIAQVQPAPFSARPMMRAMGMGLSSPEDSSGDGGGGYSDDVPPYLFDTNGLWLEITNVLNGLTDANLHNGTNQVYAIWATTNLALPFNNWRVETEVWPAHSNCVPFTVPVLNRDRLFLRAQDWTGVFANGLPCWWTWLYFGNLNEAATDLDSLGLTLLFDYTHGRDPNVIQFGLQFTNSSVNTLNAPALLDVLSGVPAWLKVLVNDTNAADALWQPYTNANVVATLGATDGTYTVYAGLRGPAPAATITWQWATVTLYASAPSLTLTNPATSTVFQSPIQLQGYASHPLNSLTFDVSNSAGIVTNQAGSLTGQFYDANGLIYTTNYFECSGIVLSGGTNLITLHATDWAGNATNVSFILNYSPPTNPLELSLVWPQNGTLISGGTFTLQAQVNDPTVSVTASLNGKLAQGLVEQNGSVWVQNLPLNAGSNAVTLTVSNVSGSVSVTNFTVVENDLGLVINPLTRDQMNQASVTVTGWIGDPLDDCVFVNGIKATVNADGSWTANGVPVNPTGTASLHAQVYVGDPVLIGEQTVNQPQPATVVLASYAGFSNEHYFNSGYNQPYLEVQTANWTYDAGGNETISGYVPSGEGGHGVNPINSSDRLPADGPGFATPGLGLTWDYFSVNTSFANWEGDATYFQRSDAAQFMIAPTGQQAAGTTNVWLVLAGASEFSDPVQDFGEGSGDLPQPPEWWQLNGQPLRNTGLTNGAGEMLGAMLVSAPAGTTPVLTPNNTQFYNNQAASLNVLVTNVMKIVDANTMQDLTGQTNTVIVGQQMNLICQLNVTNFSATNFQWTVPGVAISNYVVAVDSSSAMVVTNFPTNNASVKFYWVDGATNRVVQCSAMVDGKTVTAQVMFNVFSPLPQFSLKVSGQVAVDADNSAAVLSLHFGKNIGADVGIAMSLTSVPLTNDSFYGSYYVTQLIQTDQKINVATGTNVFGWQRDRNGLDTQVRYEMGGLGNVVILPSQLANNPIWTDSPWIPLGSLDRWVSRSDSFRSYLMFRANGPTSLPVPMFLGTWSWSGSAKTNGAAGGTLLTHTSPSPIVSATTEFPVWTLLSPSVIISDPVNWDTTNLPAFNED